METYISKITDLIQVLKSGAEFYDSAIGDVEDASLRPVLFRMKRQKDIAIGRLQGIVKEQQGERETGSSWLVKMREQYTQIAASVKNDKHYTYVSNLEEVEDKVLAFLDDALDQDQGADTLATLREIRVDAQAAHDEMKALQTEMSA